MGTEFKIDNPLRDLVHRVQQAGVGYKNQEIRYLSQCMKQYVQEDLMWMLEGLTLDELKIAFSAGIPGDAHLHASNLMSIAKQAILEQVGNRPVGVYRDVAVQEKEDPGTQE